MSEVIEILPEPPYEFPGDRRIRKIRETRDRFVVWLIRRIDALAAWRRARAAARAEYRKKMRVITRMERCRGCGFHGKRDIFGNIVQEANRVEFIRIQPTGQDPAVGAIKLTCLQCGAESHTSTVQPSREWVVLLPAQKTVMGPLGPVSK